MALLQISEPGQTPNPHERRIAVGIDLGTTHSLVAAVLSGAAECLPDDQGRVILPSVVRYLVDNHGETKRQIGFEALANVAIDPLNTIASVKRPPVWRPLVPTRSPAASDLRRDSDDDRY